MPVYYVVIEQIILERGSVDVEADSAEEALKMVKDPEVFEDLLSEAHWNYNITLENRVGGLYSDDPKQEVYADEVVPNYKDDMFLHPFADLRDYIEIAVDAFGDEEDEEEEEDV